MKHRLSVDEMATVELTSGDPAGALAAVSNAEITIYNTKIDEDEITAVFSVRRRDLKVLKKLAHGKGYGLKVRSLSGLNWMIEKVIKRPVLALGIAILLILSLYLPTRVLFIRVEGNDTVPTKLILEKSAQCGITFGASRREVRSEKLKNALLESIDQLQWAGVNTSGCVATISVRERVISQRDDDPSGVSSIVAVRDGVISSCTATSGTLQCHVGKVVRAGEVLISGYTDCGITIQAGRAQGEVYAQTRRDLQAITPEECTIDSEIILVEQKYAIIIGKKRINFYKGSGISGASCDKIYEEKYITLPGGFVLPVAIVTETWTHVQQTDAILSLQDLENTLTDFSSWYLPTQMSAGTVLTSWETVALTDGSALLQGYYACTEMIGQVRNEETIIPYGNDH